MQIQVFNVIREKDQDTWNQWDNMWYMPNSIHLNRGSRLVFLKIWRWHFCMEPKMKICSNLHWRMKMWRIQTSSLLKNEDYKLPNLVVKMKIAILKLLKIEDLKTSFKNVKKMKTISCAGSPSSVVSWLVVNDDKGCLPYEHEVTTHNSIFKAINWDQGVYSLMGWIYLIDQFHGLELSVVKLNSS